MSPLHPWWNWQTRKIQVLVPIKHVGSIPTGCTIEKLAPSSIG